MITSLEVYFVISVAVFIVSGIVLLREAKRNNFKIRPARGAYNIVLYYQELTRRHKKPSWRFWFFIVASINVVCATMLYVLVLGVGHEIPGARR